MGVDGRWLYYGFEVELNSFSERNHGDFFGASKGKIAQIAQKVS
jgi:hypothetical protein